MRFSRLYDFALRVALPITLHAMVDCASPACAPTSPVGTTSARAVTDLPQLPQQN
jgi:hypothetical protein